MITPHGDHRRYGLERCQHGGMANVSSMNDTLSPRQGCESLRAHEAMRI